MKKAFEEFDKNMGLLIEKFLVEQKKLSEAIYEIINIKKILLEEDYKRKAALDDVNVEEIFNIKLILARKDYNLSGWSDEMDLAVLLSDNSCAMKKLCYWHDQMIANFLDRSNEKIAIDKLKKYLD